jgi:hypothetical protein
MLSVSRQLMCTVAACVHVPVAFETQADETDEADEADETPHTLETQADEHRIHWFSWVGAGIEFGAMRERRADEFAALIPASKGEPVPGDVWRRMSERERIEAAAGRSLDNCMDILDLPLAMAVRSPTVMQGKVGVIRAILTCVAKVGVESARLRGMQEQLLGQLIDDFREEERGGSGEA